MKYPVKEKLYLKHWSLMQKYKKLEKINYFTKQVIQFSYIHLYLIFIFLKYNYY